MIDLVDQLWIVQRQAADEWRCVLTVLALAGAALSAAILFAAILTPFLAAVWDRIGKRRMRGGMVALVAFACLYGGAKHQTATITYPRTDPEIWYLRDAGSYVTNDAVHVAFNRNVIVPATANFFLDALELSYTNQSDWAEHSFTAYSNTMDRMTVPFDFPHSAASNFNWIAYTDWTPSPSTHTNGIAYIVWQIGHGKGIGDIVPIRTGVYTNGVRAAPSAGLTNGPSVSVSLTLTGETNYEN